jgi:hypothetical protein
MTQQQPTVTVTAYATVTTNISADIVGTIEAESGLPGNSHTDRLASTGVMEFNLDNNTVIGKYYPGHSNCLAGWDRGTPVEITFTYDSATITERWYVDNCEIEGEMEKKVHVSLVDWMDYPANHPIINPGYLEDATIDEGIAEVTSSLAVQPQDTDLNTGTNTFPSLLDTVWRSGRALREYAKLAASEPGYVYLRRPEVLTFENMLSRNGTRALSVVPIHSDNLGFLLTEAGDTLITESSDSILVEETESVEVSTANAAQIRRYEDDNGKNVINRYVSQYHPRRNDTNPILLYEPERPVPIASGERKVFTIYYIDPVSKQPINAIPPTQDPYTKALLHFEAESIGTQLTFQDDTNRTWRAYDVQAVTDIFGVPPHFGERSAYFDGSDAWIEADDSPDWDFGTGDFTIDWWEFRFDTTGGRASISRDASASFPAFLLGLSNGTNLLVDMSSAGASWDIASAKSMGSITTNAFVHYAVVRSGNNFYTFKNGVQQDTWTSSAALNTSSSVLYVGKHGGSYNSAAIDELRISKGIARWTENFTPPTEPYYVEGAFIYGWTAESGTGTEFSDDLDVTVDYGTNGAIFDITNNSANSGFLFIQLSGFGVHLDSAPDHVEYDTASIDEFGTREGRSDFSYSQDGYLPKLEAGRVIEEEREGRNVLHRIEMNANRTSSAMMRFMYTDIGSLIHAEIEKTEKDAYFWVQRKGYKIHSGNIIDYWWMLREHYSLQKGLDDMAVEFGGGANTDCVTFPYMPYVCGDGVMAFSISAWVYLDTEPSSNSYFVAGPYMDGAGSGIFITTTDRKVQFYTTRFASAPGQWTSNADPFALTTWAHIAVTWNIATTSDPVLYVNGSSVTFTETATPSGALTSAVGANFFVGNVKTPALDYTRCFDGKIKDVRYRPYVMTAAEVTTEYNSGTHSPTVGNDGQVFQAFAVKSSRYAGYTDLTLTDQTRLIDAHIGIVGTPHGSPIARTP